MIDIIVIINNSKTKQAKHKEALGIPQSKSPIGQYTSTFTLW